MYYLRDARRNEVALLAEGVDRNISACAKELAARLVALLAEGVDRNTVSGWPTPRAAEVALLAEGVDRNRFTPQEHFCSAGSPSSRRAWIEM